jgi:hypothetical protein
MIDGEPTGDLCPDCNEELYYYCGFIDCFSHTTGHYTIDSWMKVCNNPECKFAKELTGDENYETDE